MMGGRVAEEIIFAEISTGASNDIERASDLARRMVTEYGMSDKLGPLALGKKDELVFLGREINEQRNYSDEIAFEIDKEIRRLIDEAYATATRILSTHQEKLDMIAMLLMDRETISGEELEELFETPRPEPKLVGPRSYHRPDSEGGEQGGFVRPLTGDGREPPPAPDLRPSPAT
jgi:cell division protease FtsH